jgi:hypothetical protein
MSSMQSISGGQCPPTRTTTVGFRWKQLWDAPICHASIYPSSFPYRGSIEIYGSGLGRRAHTLLRLETVQGTTRNLRDAIGGTGREVRSVDHLWTRTSVTSAPTCDVSAQRCCRLRCCRSSGRYLSSGVKGSQVRILSSRRLGQGPELLT